MNQTRKGRPTIILSLGALATRINQLASEVQDRRFELCKLVAEAQDRVVRETNETFKLWASKNLRKPDGTPWAITTLYKMAMFGREPEKLMAHRAQIAHLGRAQRASLEARRAQQFSSEAELNQLLSAWGRARPLVRKQFLECIGATPLVVA